MPPPDPINLTQPAFKPPWVGDAEGLLVAPGTYSVALFIAHNGALKAYGESQEFSVKPVPSKNPTADFNAIAEFRARTSVLYGQISSAGKKLGEARNRLRYMKAAILETPKATPKLFADLNQLEQNLTALQKRLYGDRIRQSLNESASPSMNSKVGDIVYSHSETVQNPTDTQKRDIETAQADFNTFRGDLATYFNALEALEAELEAAGAPYTPGRKFD